MNPVLHLHGGQALCDSSSLGADRHGDGYIQGMGLWSSRLPMKPSLLLSTSSPGACKNPRPGTAQKRLVVGLVACPYALPILISRYFFFQDSRKHKASLGSIAGTGCWCVGEDNEGGKCDLKKERRPETRNIFKFRETGQAGLPCGELALQAPRNTQPESTW